MKSCAKMLVVAFFLAAVLLPEIVLSSKKAKKLHHVYNLHRSNDSVSKAFTRISGGIDVLNKGVYPWMAVLVTPDKNRNIFCGASLVGDQWVVTAAHCLYYDDVLNTKFLIRLGAYKLFDDRFLEYGQEFTVSKAILHDKFNKALGFYDIALLKLNKPVKETPIQLPTAADTGNIAGCIAMGFGHTNKEKERSDYMRVVHLNIIDQTVCETIRPIDDSVICAKSSGRSESGTCNGDSGGPLVCQHTVHGERMHYLRGIVTFSRTVCGAPDKYIFFADMIKLSPWIEKSIAG